MTDAIMQECYSIFGPELRLPSCMLRSYLLALKLKVTSITQWCRMLRETPLYAILSGFPVGDTPGVGTFYDFFSRMWKSDSNNQSPRDRFPKVKVPKGKKKGDKTPCDSSSIASRLLPLLERWRFQKNNPFYLIFRLYHQQLLSKYILMVHILRQYNLFLDLIMGVNHYNNILPNPILRSYTSAIPFL